MSTDRGPFYDRVTLVIGLFVGVLWFLDAYFRSDALGAGATLAAMLATVCAVSLARDAMLTVLGR